jgi:hypothetical protein
VQIDQVDLLYTATLEKPANQMIGGNNVRCFPCPPGRSRTLAGWSRRPWAFSGTGHIGDAGGWSVAMSSSIDSTMGPGAGAGHGGDNRALRVVLRRPKRLPGSMGDAPEDEAHDD